MEYLCAALKRKLDKDADKVDGPTGKRAHRSLRDNPSPIVTPALRKKKENELLDKPKTQTKSTQIHPSILAQPLIDKEKEKEKEIRDQERASPQENQIDMIEIDDPEVTVSSSQKETTDQAKADSPEKLTTNQTITNLLKEKVAVDKPAETSLPRVPRIIKMIADQKPYDIIEDLNTIKCNITLAQLLDISPKVKAKVMQGLKFKKDQTKISGAIDNCCATTILVDNIDHTYKSKNLEPNKDDIAMVDVEVDGIKGKALMNSCSNLNIITQQFLDKLPVKYEPIDISCGRIRLATQNEEYSEDYVVQIPIKINHFEMLVKYRVVNKEDPFYDILINLKTLMDYRLFIHPRLYSLCHMNDYGMVDVIAPINNRNNEEEKLLCVLKATPDGYSENDLKKIEGLPPKEYIHDKKFRDTLNRKFREQIIQLLEEYIVVISYFYRRINSFGSITT